MRFSTVGGESGSADTARDPRGFAVKFYTEDGTWDIVGNNTPIFFIRDPILVRFELKLIVLIELHLKNETFFVIVSIVYSHPKKKPRYTSKRC